MKFRYDTNPNTQAFWNNYYTERQVERKNDWLFPTAVKLLEKCPKGRPEALEVGCGAGRTIVELLKLKKDVSWTGLDFSVSGIQKANSKYPKQAKWICGDIEKMAELDARPIYDFILCVETMEHLSEPDIVCKLFFQWLKTNGTIFITVPVAGTPLDKNPKYHHVTYQPDDFGIMFSDKSAEVKTFQIDKHHLGVTVRKG